jgi:hypothetical protein
MEQTRIYPRGSQLLPERHKVASTKCVPERIQKIYEEIWPLRHIAPNAFAGQIRRALEFICHDQEAQGRTLFEQLKDLSNRGTFPGYFSEITELMRLIGNFGAHALSRCGRVRLHCSFKDRAAQGKDRCPETQWHITLLFQPTTNRYG